MPRTGRTLLIIESSIMLLKPDGKMAPILLLTLVSIMCVGYAAGYLVAAARHLLPIDAALVAGLLFIYFIAVIVTTFRRHKSFVLTEQGVSLLSPVRGLARYFFRLEKIFIEWRDVQKLRLKGIHLILDCNARSEGINLLWFKNPSNVIEFVSRCTSLVPERK
jgi:hypothetical protein